jgi:hypothetical protein
MVGIGECAVRLCASGKKTIEVFASYVMPDKLVVAIGAMRVEPNILGFA